MSITLRPDFPAAPVPVDAAVSGPAVATSAGPAGPALTRQREAGPATPDDPVAKVLARAIIQLIRLPVPPIRGIADGQDLLGRRDLLAQLAKIIDPVIAEIMSECAEHTHEVDRSYYKTILSDAFEDRAVLGTLELAAEKLGVDEDDIADDPRGWERARQLGVD